MKFVTYSTPSHDAFQSRDIVVHTEKNNAYTKDGSLNFRVWTNRGKQLRSHSYRCVVFMPSYHERERRTIPGVVKNAVKDIVEAIKEEVYKPGQVLILMVDGTNKQHSIESVTGTHFLLTMFDQEIRDAVERYEIDFATVVTEDCTIFSSHPGLTDIRGKGSQIECALNFIYRVCVPEAKKAENESSSLDAHFYCIDSDLGKTDGWIGRLYQAMRSGGIDYTISYFLKYKYDDMITVNFSYPLISALAGVAVRQCMTGIFAFKGYLLQELVQHTTWNQDWRRYGVDVSILLTSIRKRMRMVQVLQESPLNGEVHFSQEFKMFQQVCSSLFRQLEPHAMTLKPTSEVWCPQLCTNDPDLYDFSNLDYTGLCSKEASASHYLQFFMKLYANRGFKANAKDVLGHALFDKVKFAYNRLVESDLGSVTDYQTPTMIPEHKASEYGNCLLRIGSENLLNARTWANIVMQSWKSFCRLKSREGVEMAIERVAVLVLPCVFHLRCLGLIVETWDLTSYPDTEELVQVQRDEFIRMRSILFDDTNNKSDNFVQV